MAGLSEAEEFELLSLEREKALSGNKPSVVGSTVKKLFPAATAAVQLGMKGIHALDEAAYNAGGKVTDLATSAGLPSEAAAAAGTVTNIGVQSIPTLVGGMASKAAPLLESAASTLMQKALKPGVKAQRIGDAPKAIETMLEGGYNATRGGAQKLQGHIDNLETQISEAIAGSGATVDKGAVGSRINDVVARIEKSNSTPQDALKDVEKVYTQFMENDLIPKNIPVERAMELKRGIYRMLKDKYGQIGSDTVEAQKALGRGYKETMAEAVPEIAGPLSKQSELIRALKLVERRAMTEGNNNPASLGVSLATAAHNPLAALGLWANSSGYAKSMIARGMYQGAERIPGTAGQLAGAGVGLHMGQDGAMERLLRDIQDRR